MSHTTEMLQEQRITFPSTAENISIVEKLVNDVCSVFQIPEDYYGNILVALTEAVNNAIHHGNKLDAGKQVTVVYSVTPEKLDISVTDQGPGFDFNNLPDPTNPENLEKPNGRGVFLMRNLADHVDFSDEGRTVNLNFNLNSAKA
jgi:serine/threonine-protein kinase RsbW